MENQNYNKIEKYLLQKMTLEDCIAFEAELSKNEVLQAQFQKQKLEHEAMDFFLEKDLRKKLDIWKNEPFDDEPLKDDFLINKPKKSSAFPRILWLISAAILGLIFLWLWQTPKPIDIEDTSKSTNTNIGSSETQQKMQDIVPINTNKEEKEEEIPPTAMEEKEEEQPKLVPPKKTGVTKPKPNPTKQLIAYADELYNPYDFTNIQLRGGDTSLMDSAKTALAAKELEKAIEQLQRLQDVDDNKLEVTYWLGLVYYNKRAFSTAIPYMEMSLLEDSNNIDIERIEWRLVLSYLHNQQNTLAVNLLKKIIDDKGHEKERAATELLSKIEHLYK